MLLFFFSQAWSTFKKNSLVQLDLANKIWLQKDYQIKDIYKDILATFFKVNVEIEDFRINADNILKQINS